MKKYSTIFLLVSSFLLITVACTKEITEDIFDFNENFFTLQSNVENNAVEVNELVNFTFEVQENAIPSIYTLDFSTNREGAFRFEGNTFISGQSTTIETGVYGFTYLPTDEGTHNINFSVTNANETPLSLTESYLIAVGDVANLETGFTVQIDISSDQIAVGETTIITVTIIEEVDIPESATYTIDFGSSTNGVFVSNEETFVNEGQLVIEDNQQVFAFTPQIAEEYDIKLSVSSLFDGTSVCESANLIATSTDGNTAPTVLISTDPDPAEGESPLTIQFTSQVMDPDIGDTFTYSWDFGDGSPVSSEENPTHEYILAGAASFTTYTATLTVNDGTESVDETIDITVNESQVLVESIIVEPEDLSLEVGTTDSISVNVFPINATNPSVTFTSNNTFVATVDNTGRVTPVSFGSTTIDVLTEDGSGVSASVPVFVSNSDPVAIITTEDVIMGEAPLTITFDGSESFDPDGDNLTYEWDVNALTTSQITRTFSTPGNFSVSLTVDDGNGGINTTRFNIVVTEPNIPVTGVSIEPFIPSPFLVDVNTRLDLTANIEPENATNKNVIWTSSMPSSASVTQDGVITIFPNNSDSVTIEVRTEDGDFSSSFVLLIEEPLAVRVTGVDITSTFTRIDENDTRTLTAEINPSNATNQELIWTTLDNGIVSVDSATGEIRGEGEGETTITVSTADGNFRDSIIIEVEEEEEDDQIEDNEENPG